MKNSLVRRCHCVIGWELERAILPVVSSWEVDASSSTLALHWCCQRTLRLVPVAARSLLALTAPMLWVTGEGHCWTHSHADPYYFKSMCHFMAPLPWHMSCNPWHFHSKLQLLSSKESSPRTVFPSLHRARRAKQLVWHCMSWRETRTMSIETGREAEISACGVNGLLMLLLPNPSSPRNGLILCCFVNPLGHGFSFTRSLHDTWHSEAPSIGPAAPPGS